MDNEKQNQSPSQGTQHQKDEGIDLTPVDKKPSFLKAFFSPSSQFIQSNPDGSKLSFWQTFFQSLGR